MNKQIKTQHVKSPVKVLCNLNYQLFIITNFQIPHKLSRKLY